MWSVENDEKRRRLMGNDDEKCAALVAESCVMTFAIHCGEHRRDVWRKKSTVESKTKWKESSASCLSCCERFAMLIIDGDDGERETCSIWDVMIGVTSWSAGLVIQGIGDLLCPPMLEWRTIATML